MNIIKCILRAYENMRKNKEVVNIIENSRGLTTKQKEMLILNKSTMTRETITGLIQYYQEIKDRSCI